MSAIEINSEVQKREREAASCGFIPVSVFEHKDGVLVFKQFIQVPSIDYGLRVPCPGCNHGSLWKRDFAALNNENEALCSNDVCQYHLTLKVITEIE